MKTYWESGGVASRLLNLGTRWKRVVSFTPRPLWPQGISPRYPLARRLGKPQRQSVHGGEEKNSQPQPGIEPQNAERPARTKAISGLKPCDLFN
jgi:hypothetical protein